MKNFSKRIFSVAACAGTLMTAALCGACSHSETSDGTTLFKPASEAEISEAEKYLLENGYSEEFIKATGAQAKIRLYNCGAAFESSAAVSFEEGEGDFWQDFSGTVTVSDIPADEEYEVRKYVTYNWRAGLSDGVYTPEGDSVSLFWTDGFTALSDEGMSVEIFADVTAENSSDSVSLTALSLSGDKAFSEYYISSGISFNLPETAVGGNFTSSDGETIYRTDGYCRGTYMVILADYYKENGLCRVTAKYTHAETTTATKFKLSIFGGNVAVSFYNTAEISYSEKTATAFFNRFI